MKTSSGITSQERTALARFHEIVGREQTVEQVSRALCFMANEMAPPVVGALHVTCADETELECANAFQRGFVQHVLPSLKPALESAMRLANLGARYEWGAIRVAEAHYATEATRSSYKLMVVKINGHVATKKTVDGETFGTMDRYDTTSSCCGALTAMLGAHRHEPFVEDLRTAFSCEGKDRIGVLLDEERVPAVLRRLLAAIVSARLQARRAFLDIQDFQPTTPTLYVVVPCVTLNRPGRDGEIVCGTYVADHRGEERFEEYYGLGDEPGAYRLRHEHGHLVVEDEVLGISRAARDHRGEVLRSWRCKARLVHANDERMERIRRDVEADKHHEHPHAKALLRILLTMLTETSPVGAAVLLFAHGAASIHHTHRAHMLATECAGEHEARQILQEIHERVETLEPEQARAILEMLVRETKG